MAPNDYCPLCEVPGTALGHDTYRCGDCGQVFAADDDGAVSAPPRAPAVRRCKQRLGNW